MEDLECRPVSYEECEDTAVEVPFLEQEEQCEEVEKCRYTSFFSIFH